MNISQLPIELKLMIVQHCALQSCKALSLVSKEWYQCVLDQSIWEARIQKDYYHEIADRKDSLRVCDLLSIVHRYGLTAIQEWALSQEPEGEIAYAKLQAIDTFQTQDMQKKLEQLAEESQTVARLILYYSKYWYFIQDSKLRSDFLKNIIHQWPAAIYYALDDKNLQKHWLPFVLSLERSPFVLYMEIRAILRIGGVRIAWLWSTQPELYVLLAHIVKEDTWFLPACIWTIIENGNQAIAKLWSTDAKLCQLVEKTAGNSSWLFSCIKKILDVGGQEVALLWSTDARLRKMLTHFLPQEVLRLVYTVVKAGGEQAARLWATTSELHEIIAKAEQGDRLDCLNWLIETGGEKARAGCLAHATLEKDLSLHNLELRSLALV